MKTTTSASGPAGAGGVMPLTEGFPYRAIAIYPNFADVGAALSLLNREGYGKDQISVLGQEQEHWQEKLNREWETLKTTKGALGGAALGAIPGLALVAGIALTGGVGVLVAGPMLAGMSAIGMGTVVGSLMGAGSTNIDGAEKILDVEEEVTDAIRHGQWVIIVHSRTSADAERAQTLLPNRRIVREDKPGTAALSDFAAEQVDIRKLGGIVEEAFESVAKESTLPAQEVLCNIEDIDVAPLKQAVTKAMKNIADATNLHTAQITGVFRANRVASVNDIVNRLHEQSKANRSTF